jgi:hypothetical protein
VPNPRRSLVVSDDGDEIPDLFDVPDLEFFESNTQAFFSRPERIANPVAQKYPESRRYFGSADVEVINADSYVDKKPEEICPYNPNHGGNYIKKNEEKMLWESRPFLKIYNITSREDLEQKVKKYLGPLPTSGESWEWRLGEKLKTSKLNGGTGRKFYCSFGGRALTKSIAVPKKVRTANIINILMYFRTHELARRAKLRPKPRPKSRGVDHKR